MAVPGLPPGFNFTDPDIYAHRLPVQELAELRRAAPIWWNEQPPDVGGFGDGGYWVVTKHRDAREVSLRTDVFSSAEKSVVPRRTARRSARGPRKAVRLVQQDDR
jgi:cholest-4-en-3-one 26-monooxygenase